MQPQQKPSIGRKVIYTYPQPFVLSDLKQSGPDQKITFTEAPAEVQHVNADGSLRLIVFGPLAHMGHQGYEMVPNAREWPGGDAPSAGTWIWPPRV
jgi:hypothetical protein